MTHGIDRSNGVIDNSSMIDRCVRAHLGRPPIADRDTRGRPFRCFDSTDGDPFDPFDAFGRGRGRVRGGVVDARDTARGLPRWRSRRFNPSARSRYVFSIPSRWFLEGRRPRRGGRATMASGRWATCVDKIIATPRTRARATRRASRARWIDSRALPRVVTRD